MKKFARLICLLLTAMLATGSLAACGGSKGSGRDNEKDVFTIATGELDNVFSPYFSTSAYDQEVWGMTQISMLSTNSEGEVYVGEDEPTMAVNYNQKVFINGQHIPDDQVQEETAKLSDAQKEDGSYYYTEYEFLIKNGVKDSRGEDLTIKDVVYNMYVYLDPMYTGSSTMYSTDIKGLAAYRTQDPSADAETSGSFESTFNTKAITRRSAIQNYFESDTNLRDSYRKSIDAAKEQEILDDVILARRQFWKELNDDWSSAQATVQDEENEYGFSPDEGWKVFLINYQLIDVKRDDNGKVHKYDAADDRADGNEDGKIEIGTDVSGNPIYKNIGDLAINDAPVDGWYTDKENVLKIVFNSKLGILTNAGSPIKADNNAPKIDFKLEKETLLIDGDTSVDENGNTLSDADLRVRIKNDRANLSNNISSIVSYYATSNTMFDYWLADEQEKYFNQEGVGNRVQTITGITVEKLTAGADFVGKNTTTRIEDPEQYVLKIAINGVDPKAIWNFGFTVAPMSYYSNPSESAYPGQGYKYFNYPGCPGYDNTKDANVGFKTFSQQYMTDVLQSVSRKPVGAGVYQASNNRGATGSSIGATDFYSNNIVYFARNEYFYTTGKEMSNAKIKYLQYKVIATSAIVNSLDTGEIDYGTPNSKPEVRNQINGISKLQSFAPLTNGYGYVGINASYVKNIHMRRAFMTAMDTSLVRSYYGDTAQLIYRPMSLVSTIYRDENGALDSSYSPTDAYPGLSEEDRRDYDAGRMTESEREEIIKSAIKAELNQMTSSELRTNSRGEYTGWYDRDEGKWKSLTFTFTIAGAETDHPAYQTLREAADFLNDLGFNITVLPDANALSKLAAGSLEVWAAAWSSTIDPDMYQVYHKDSQATSVNNWGYRYLLDSNSQHVTEERQIIDDLADLIEEGRSVLDMNSRRPIYREALELVMDLAVEYPLYQRTDLYVINKNVIDIETINTDPTPYEGVLAKMWEISFKN